MKYDLLKVKLVREEGTTYKDRVRVDSPRSLVDFILSATGIENEPVEQMWVVLFDVKNTVVGLSLLSVGTCNASLVSPRELMRLVLLSSATSFAIFHNHPSGNPSPSAEDINVTKRILEVSKLMDINLIDHIVIGNNDYVSIRETIGF